MAFHISKKLTPAGDQPQAIKKLVAGFKKNAAYETLLGVTGSGKTLTMAHTIQQLGKPTLVISHNKTLAAQLYEEFKSYFPHDHVHYFVSYYDYYQPEAYLPNSDTYIEKTAQINKEIEQLRHAAVQSVLEHDNTIIIASVSCIYNLGSPQTFRASSITLRVGDELSRKDLLKQLLALQYERNEYDFWHGTFRQRDEYIDFWPPGGDVIIRAKIEAGVLTELHEMQAPFGTTRPITQIKLFPSKFWISEEHMRDIAIANITKDLTTQVDALQKKGSLLEAERLKRRTRYDIALIREVGWCKGIENYTRYFEGRPEGSSPFTLMDYFPKDYLLIVDESHMTIPQIRGMYFGDKSRKETLVAHGFRLPSALDNRPLTFEEFSAKTHMCLFASATPSEYELGISSSVAEQIVRPTFLLDPDIEIRPIAGQIPDLIEEIIKRAAAQERILVTVLTKRLSEALAQHLKEKKIKAVFLHSEIDTLERPKILRDLRLGKYDVIVGVNLLREGLDLPEVSLVAILDADKEGFLRDTTSFIQIAGRAARHLHGHVIMYADTIATSIKKALSETARRRRIQETYNTTHHTVPRQIIKDITYTLEQEVEKEEEQPIQKEFVRDYLAELKQKLELAQRNLQFEEAIRLKEKINTIKKEHTSKKIPPKKKGH